MTVLMIVTKSMSLSCQTILFCCHTPVPPDDPASTSNNHHGIEVKDEVKDDYSSDEAILCDVTYTDLSHVKMLSLISTSVSQLLNDF